MNLKKKESKNMERYKNLFLEIGLVVSLFIVFAAFEWKTTSSTHSYVSDNFYTPIEMDPVIRIEEPKKAPIIPITTILNITNKEVATKTPEINMEWTSEPQEPTYTPISVPIMDVEVIDTGIIAVPPEMPIFPGGDNGLTKYMQNSIHYPIQDREIGLQGIVYVSFVIEKNGQISNVNLARGIGGQCDEEALRVIKAMPIWTPGKNSLGRPVRVKLTMPVRFTLID